MAVAASLSFEEMEGGIGVEGCQVVQKLPQKGGGRKTFAVKRFFSPPHILKETKRVEGISLLQKDGRRAIFGLIPVGTCHSEAEMCHNVFSADFPICHLSSTMLHHFLLILKEYSRRYSALIYALSPLPLPAVVSGGQIPDRRGSTSSYSSHSLCQHEHTYPSLISYKGVFPLT